MSILGFLLLEEVELAFGSAKQEICSLEYLLVADQLCLAALASRDTRQGSKMTRWFLTQCLPFLAALAALYHYLP